MNVIGFDDGPFRREHRGDVLLVGAVCARTRLDGVVSGKVRRDGANAADVIAALVRRSQFQKSVRAVLLQGIAVAGFNVVDVHRLSRALSTPVLVVMRRKPDFGAIERALFGRSESPRVSGAARKWRLIRAAGPPERIVVPRSASRTGVHRNGAALWVQRVGLSPREAESLLAATSLHGAVPEPLRLAHLIAGGMVTGISRGRA